MKMKTKYSNVKFSKSNKNKEWLIYTNQKLQQFKFIYILILTSVKLTVFIKITVDSELIKKNKFKKLKKFISEFNLNNVQLFNTEKMTFIDNIIQTSNIIN